MRAHQAEGCVGAVVCAERVLQSGTEALGRRSKDAAARAVVLVALSLLLQPLALCV